MRGCYSNIARSGEGSAELLRLAVSIDEREQTEILGGIWNEMKALNGCIGETNARLDQHGDEHRDLRERVERLERKVGIGR